MADHFGGVPLSPEVNSLKAEIGSDQDLMATGDLQNSAVIPYSSCDPTAFGSCAAADERDQLFFGVGQLAPGTGIRD